MVGSFFETQGDYILFIYGLALTVLGVVCLALQNQKKKSLPWFWLGWFGLIRASSEWLGIIAFAFEIPYLAEIRLFLLVASSLCLVEFGRSGWSELKKRTLGRWVYLPLICFAMLGGIYGLPGLTATVRYSLGLVGGVWSIAVLVQLARTEKDAKDWLLLTAVNMSFFIFFTAIVAKKALFFPAMIINNDLVERTFGIPVQLVRGIFAGLAGATLWRYFILKRLEETRQRDNIQPSKNTYNIFGLSISTLLCLVIALGWVVTDRIGNTEDREYREEVQATTEALALMVTPEAIKEISAANSNQNPTYQRLMRQFTTILKSQERFDSIYLLGVRRGEIFFYLDAKPRLKTAVSLPPLANPGEVYHEAASEVYTIFKTGQKTTIGPVVDRWGEWVSSLVPIVDSRTRETIAVLELDINSHDWAFRVAMSRLGPISVILLLSLLLITFLEVLRRNEQSRIDLEQHNRKLTLANVDMEEKYAQSYTIKLIQEEIGRELDTDQLLSKTADIVMGVLGSRRCAIYLADDEAKVLVIKADSGFVSNPETKQKHAFNSGHLAAQSWRDRKTYTRNLNPEGEPGAAGCPLHRLLTVPLNGRQGCLGVMVVEYESVAVIGDDIIAFAQSIAQELSLSVENAYLYGKMRQMAIHDGLTGVYNRMYLMSYIQDLFAAQPKEVSVIMMDLDFFKKVNDRFGHLAGDIVLKITSRLMQDIIATAGIVARYGGEEFIAVLPEINQEAALLLAEKLRATIEEHHYLSNGGEWIPVTLSVGLANFPTLANDYEHLLQQADEALYQAKESGRNKVCVVIKV